MNSSSKTDLAGVMTHIIDQCICAVRRLTLQDVVLITGFGAISILYYSWGWSHELANFGGDSAAYLLAARYYSPYQEMSPAIEAFGRQIFYPPIFPLLLAFVGAGENILHGHLLVITFALLSILVVFFWARQESLSDAKSAMIALVIALMPATYLQSLNVWTENIYMFFSILAILSVTQAEKDEESEKWLWAAVASIIAATLVRVAAVPLLIAFLFYVIAKKPKRGWLFVVVAVLPFAVWMGINTAFQPDGSPYIYHWFDQYGDDIFGTLARQLYIEAFAVIQAWRYAWIQDGSLVLPFLATIIIGLICIVGWFRRLLSLKFDALYVAIYALQLFAWPHPEEALRYSYVVFPVLIVQGFLAIENISLRRVRIQGYEVGSAVLIAVMMLLVLPSLLLNVGYFMQRVPEEFEAGKRTENWYSSNRIAAEQSALFHARVTGHLKALESQVGQNECIFSIKSTVITLYSNRTSVAPPRVWESDEVFWKKIEQCRYAYILPFASPSYSEPFYPLARLGDRARVLSTVRLVDMAGAPTVGSLVEILPAE